jgi:hypothetical protein
MIRPLAVLLQQVVDGGGLSIYDGKSGGSGGGPIILVRLVLVTLLYISISR